MSQESQVVDDEYLNGVWMDRPTGQFVRFEVNTTYNEIEVYRLGDDDKPLHTVEPQAWNKYEREDYSKVPQAAVSDPASFVMEATYLVAQGSGKSMKIDESFATGVAYARSVTDTLERVSRE
jgi:hypothetical protein